MLHLPLGVVKNSAIADILREKYPGINLIEVKNTKEGLSRVSKGLLVGYINTSIAVGEGIRRYGMSDLKIAGEMGIDYQISVAARNDEKTLLSIFNKAIESLESDIDQKIREKWISVNFEKSIDYTIVWQLIFMFAIVLGLSLYWIRKLKKEIKEKELAQKEVTKLSQAVEFSPSLVTITDPYGNVEYVNQAFCAVNGYTRKEILGVNLNVLKSGKMGKEVYQDFWRTINQGATWSGEMINKTKNGEFYWVSLAISPVFSPQGDITNFLSIAEHIEEKKQYELKLKEGMEKANEATKAKSEFLANMSHDIRTPMNSILGFSEILQKKVKDPIQREYLHSISVSGNTLLELINDILDLSRIEAGKLKVTNSSVNPYTLFNEMNSIFRVKTEAKGLDLSIEVCDELPESILTDGMRVRQILINLIGNSVKFTDSGHIKVGVKPIFTDETKSHLDLVFFVEDTGHGIEKRYLEKIFGTFEQGGDSKKQIGGSGLGLSICKNLTELLNGKIEVISEVGVGTTFTVTLKDIPVSSAKADEEVQSIENKITFEKARVLVADDIADNRKLVRAFFDESEIDVVEADNGKSALEVLENENIDLVVLDIKMPVMNGYETIQVIKNDEKKRDVPVIALTASVMGKDLEKVQEYKFDGYLRKPVSQKEIFLELAKTNKPDLILLDIIMSPTDGFEACEILKSESSTKDIPIIFLTAKTDDESILKGFKLGGADYITKPFKSEELLARVKTQLKIKEYYEHIIEQEKSILKKSKFDSIGDLISNIAHQWRQPLNAIILNNELLVQEYQQQRLDRNIFNKITKNISDNVHELSSTIENFRNYFVFNAQKVDFDITNSVKEIIKLLENTLNSFNITIDIQEMDLQNEPITYILTTQ